MYALVFATLFFFKVNGALYKSSRFQSVPLQKNVPLQQSFGTGIQNLGPTAGVFQGANGVTISQINGKNEITINGKMVDLLRASLVEENNEFQIFEPVEFPGARIAVNKLTGKIRVDYGTTHVQTQTPEEAKARITESMTKMQAYLKHMREHLNKMLTGFRAGFPFFGGSAFSTGSRSARKKRF